MNVRTLCLAILNIQDATGYEIKKLSIEGSFQHFVEVSYGSIYPALAKLESDGLVSCQTHAQDGRPDKKVYSITPAGKMAFIDLINVLPKPDIFKSEFLLLALNADIADPAVLQAAIAGHSSQYESELKMLDEVLADCDQPALLWAANYGKATLKAKLDYLNKNKQELMNMAGKSFKSPAAE